MTNIQKKVCLKCKIEKAINDYDRSDGVYYNNKCKKCRNEEKYLRDRLKSYARPENIIDDLPGEVWVDVLKNEGKYQVSNLGRIKSVGRILEDVLGIKRRKLASLLKQKTEGCGYKRVEISPYVLVHNIVFYSFNRDIVPVKGFIIDHKDEDKSNNRLDNLQRITHSQNVQKTYILK